MSGPLTVELTPAGPSSAPPPGLVGLGSGGGPCTAYGLCESNAQGQSELPGLPLSSLPPSIMEGSHGEWGVGTQTQPVVKFSQPCSSP